MELPPYRLPTVRGVLIHTWERTWHYIRKAGTIILAISVLLWAMMTFPHLPAEKAQTFESARQQIAAQYPLPVVQEVKNTGGEGAPLSPEARALSERLDDIQALLSSPQAFIRRARCWVFKRTSK